MNDSDGSSRHEQNHEVTDDQPDEPDPCCTSLANNELTGRRAIRT